MNKKFLSFPLLNTVMSFFSWKLLVIHATVFTDIVIPFYSICLFVNKQTDSLLVKKILNSIICASSFTSSFSTTCWNKSFSLWFMFPFWSVFQCSLAGLQGEEAHFRPTSYPQAIPGNCKCTHFCLVYIMPLVNVRHTPQSDLWPDNTFLKSFCFEST